MRQENLQTGLCLPPTVTFSGSCNCFCSLDMELTQCALQCAKKSRKKLEPRFGKTDSLNFLKIRDVLPAAREIINLNLELSKL